ncbi:MAG: hypothetical protein ABEK50_00100, partial [bacterium]
DLSESWPGQAKIDPDVNQDPYAGFNELVERSSPDDLIAVAGSFHHVGALRQLWIT